MEPSISDAPSINQSNFKITRKNKENLELQFKNKEKSPQNTKIYSAKLQELNSTSFLSKSNFLVALRYLIFRGNIPSKFLNSFLNLIKQNSFLENSSQNFIELVESMKIMAYLVQNIDQSVQKQLKAVYPKLLAAYKTKIAHPNIIHFIFNHECSDIRSWIITNFISEKTTEKYTIQVKKLYLQMFNKIFDNLTEGSSQLERKNIEGIFQIILIYFDYEDSEDIIKFLRKVEKSLVSSLSDFDLQTYSLFYLCSKYGFKSYFFASKMFEMIQSQWKNKEQIESLKYAELSRQMRLRAEQNEIVKFSKNLHFAWLWNIFLKIIDHEGLPMLKKNKFTEIQQRNFNCKNFQKKAQFLQKLIASAQQKSINLGKKLTIFKIYEIQSFFSDSNSFGDEVWKEMIRTAKKFEKPYSTINIGSSLGTGFKKEPETFSKNINFEKVDSQKNIKKTSNDDELILLPEARYSSFWEENHISRFNKYLVVILSSYQLLIKQKRQKEADELIEISITDILKCKKIKEFPFIYSAFPDLFRNFFRLFFFSKNFNKSPLKEQIFSTSQILSQSLKQNPNYTRLSSPIYKTYVDHIERNQIYRNNREIQYLLESFPKSTTEDLISRKVRYNKLNDFWNYQIQQSLKEKNPSIIFNYIEYPYFADIRYTKAGVNEVVLVKYSPTKSVENFLLDVELTKFQLECEKYFKNKRYRVTFLSNLPNGEEIQNKIKF